jgi:neutral ceramidase
MKPGTIPPTPLGVTTDQVKTNPGINNPGLVEPAGPTDPEVAFISVQSLERQTACAAGELLAALRRRRRPGHISADYFGEFAVKIGQLLGAGPEFVGIMSNGTSGDINNIDFRGGQESSRRMAASGSSRTMSHRPSRRP